MSKTFPIIGGIGHGTAVAVSGDAFHGKRLEVPYYPSAAARRALNDTSTVIGHSSFCYKLRQLSCERDVMFAWLPADVPDDDVMRYVLEMATKAVVRK